MTRWRAKCARAWRAVLGAELSMFLGYALIVFRPGAEPPKHPETGPIPERAAPTDWTDGEYQLYIDEARLDMASQQADKRDIRARAQIILTTGLVVGGAIAASYEGKSHLCIGGNLAYLAAAVFTTIAVFSAGGIITAKSSIGVPNVMALPYTETGALYRRVADEYAHTRLAGASTVAVLVTVLRDCVLSLILGAAALAAAHVWT